MDASGVDGQAFDGAAVNDTAAACPLPTAPNALEQVQAAEAQPPWVEMHVTILFQDPPFDFSRLATASDAERTMLLAERQAQLAPFEDELQQRLLAVGAREIYLNATIAFVSAIVTAAHLPEIPCWPYVTEIDGDALACNAGGPCGDACFACAACSGVCAPLLADRLDLARGCVEHGVPLACGGPYTAAAGAGVLSCYTRKDTNEVFVADTPWLIDAGDTMVRKCTPAEGGVTPPSTLPACPHPPPTAADASASDAVLSDGGTCSVD